MADDLDPAIVERVVGQMRLWLLGLGSLTLAQVDDLAPKMARAALVAAGPLVTPERDAQVAARAWGEGYRDAIADTCPIDGSTTETPNPYEPVQGDAR